MASQDPINDVSDTALWVAAHRAEETKRPDALYKDPLAELLVGDRGRAIAKQMPYPQILGWIMAIRTVAIDRLIFEAIDYGVDTIINLGAGLDTRPYRLDLPPSLSWIEIDFEHMIKLKNEKLADQKPKCNLRRIPLDLSNRTKAQQVYAELGAQTKKALIITEGVIIYLTDEQAGHLADDLRAVSTFRYWIQDYRKGGMSFRPPNKLKAKMKSAPFQFAHPDPLKFFAEHGWKTHHNIFAAEEGERLGRSFPMPFPWNLFVWLVPQKRKDEFRKASGYVMLEAKN